MRTLRSVVVFPVFGLVVLLPKIQILWWSLGHGLALSDPGAHGIEPDIDLLDDYCRPV